MSPALDVEGISVSGSWLRHIPTGGDPLYQPSDPADYRWQRGSEIDALYLAEDEATMWAEWYRGLADRGLPPMRGMPRDVWTWEVSLPNVADLSDYGKLERVALPSARPDRTQWPVFRKVGEQLHRDGWQAILFASAARPKGLNLCAFRDNTEVPGLAPIPPPETVEDPPAVPKGLRT